MKRSLLAALAGLAAGFSGPHALAQDADLRGTLETPGVESDASITAEPDPAKIEAAIAEEDPPIPKQDEKEEEEELRRRKKSSAVPGSSNAPAADDKGTVNRKLTKRPERKGSNVNRLPAKQETAVKAESVRGLKGLEKQPNTAVNTPGEAVLPPGLAPNTALESTADTDLEPRADRRKRSKKRDRKRGNAETTGSTEDNPFTPLGISAGDATLFPSLSTAIGYDSNPSRTAKGDGSFFNRTEAGLRLTREGPSDTLEGALTAGYDAYLNDTSSNRPTVDANVSYERELGATTSAELIGRLGVSTEEVSSPNAKSQAVESTVKYKPGVTLGLTQEVGLMSFRLRGSLDRESFTGVELKNGKTASQDDRNVTAAGLALRAAYDPDGNISPFAEVEADRRFFDQNKDRKGRKRNSFGYGARLGVSLNTDSGLEGEVSAGYGLRSFTDSAFDDLGGFVFNAELSYQLTPLTKLSLEGETAFEDSTLSTSSGTLSNTLNFAIEHELMRNLILKANLGLTLNNSSKGGTDTQVKAGVGADYSFSREIVGTTRFNYEHQWSSGSADYDAYSLLFGVRLQR